MTEAGSYELAQWRAFEKRNGPLGSVYSDDMLANIHEQLQAVQFILGRMSAGDESPVPQPHKVRRPNEVFTKSVDDFNNEAQAEALRAQLAYEQRMFREQSERDAAVHASNAAALAKHIQELPGT